MSVEFTLVTGDISPRIVRGDGDDDDEKEGQEEEYGEDADVKHDIAYCNMHIARHSVLKNIVIGKILDGSDAPTIKERRKKDSFMNGGARNIISFGSGTFTSKVNSDWKTHSAFQHAPLLTMCDLLRETLDNTSTEDIKILAQDPAYTQQDKDILTHRARNHNPRRSRRFSRTGRSLNCVVVRAIGTDKQIALDLCRPLMLISDNVRPENDQEVKMSNPDTPRIRDLIMDHYDIFDFAQDPDNLRYEDNFGHVSIYVRRPD
ncbi:hypothetical protein TCE0_044r16303 [Talaromyces pinophilus]|uniref:SRR1-like domain-containing protein n=1 Tax=Talaromyces pinophilus TaxID=128442 RepID=A0A478EAL7_TALPI|nr:hypothetical protein TCE0_044r16303 [Talaromyces pinophilus]